MNLGAQLLPQHAVSEALCHDHVIPSCPDVASVPIAVATWEFRCRHIEHLLVEIQCVPGLGSSVARLRIQVDFYGFVLGRIMRRRCCWRRSRPVIFPMLQPRLVLSRSCLTLGHMSPWHTRLQWLNLVAVFLLGVSSVVCARQAPAAPMVARFPSPGGDEGGGGRAKARERGG